MKKFILFFIVAWLTAPFLTAFQAGAMAGIGIGAAKAFTGFVQVATSLLLWGILIIVAFIAISSVFSKKKKSEFKKSKVNQ